jgi:hypothetical protein
MSKKGKTKNARLHYRQQFLSGYESLGERKNSASGSEENGSKTNETSPDITGKKYYQVLVPIIIETVSTNDFEHNIRLHLNANSNVSISAYSLIGKKAIEPTIAIPRETGEKAIKIPMVYGVHPSGEYSLSYPIGYKPHTGFAEIYSFILGKVDSALRRGLLKPEKQENDENARKRAKGSPTPQDLGKDKA